MNAQTHTAMTPRVSLIEKFSARFSVEPVKLLETLKRTAFRTEREATNEQMMALLVVADQYKLNPFTREIYAFEDKHRGIVPVVGVDGWARIINEHPAFDGMDFAEADDGAWCECVMYRKDRQHPTKVREWLSECRRSTGPWQSHPRRMLRHKAMIQCGRVAFGFAGIYDPDEAERILEAEARVVATQPARTRTEQVKAALKAGASEPPAEAPGETVVVSIPQATDAVAKLRACRKLSTLMNAWTEVQELYNGGDVPLEVESFFRARRDVLEEAVSLGAADAQ